MYQTFDADGTTGTSSHISAYTLDPIMDPNNTNIQTGVTTNDTQDFGYNDTGLGSLGNYVWHDYNEDGIQDATEPGLENITLNLLDGNGDAIYTNSTTGETLTTTEYNALPATDPTNPNQSQYEVYITTTDSNGLYLFENLPSGDYQVAVDASTVPTDMYQTSDYDDQGTTTPTTPHTSSYTLTDVLNSDGEIE
jgi:hypothetical protein